MWGRKMNNELSNAQQHSVTDYSDLRRDLFRRQLVDKMMTRGITREMAIQATGNSYEIMAIRYESNKSFSQIVKEFVTDSVQSVFKTSDKIEFEERLSNFSRYRF